MRVNAKVRESLLLIIAFNDFLLINFLMSGFLPTELWSYIDALGTKENVFHIKLWAIAASYSDPLYFTWFSNIKRIKVQIMSNFDFNISVLTPGPGMADGCLDLDVT